MPEQRVLGVHARLWVPGQPAPGDDGPFTGQRHGPIRVNLEGERRTHPLQDVRGECATEEPGEDGAAVREGQGVRVQRGDLVRGDVTLQAAWQGEGGLAVRVRVEQLDVRGQPEDGEGVSDQVVGVRGWGHARDVA